MRLAFLAVFLFAMLEFLPFNAIGDCGPNGAPCLIGTLGDIDLDGDIDAADWPLIAACQSGPGSALGGACLSRDLDQDGDCDLRDLAAFQEAFTGSCDCPPNLLPPVAQFSVSPYLGVAPLTVYFDAGRTRDNEALIASYAWNFGDGGQASGRVLSHVFTQPGNYSVTLTATDAGGLADQTSVVVTVSDGTYNINAPVSENEARRFLWQAAFGPDPNSVAYIVQHGYAAWINAQAALPIGTINWAEQEANRIAGYGWNGAEEVWDDICIEGADQLRQRMAWALIQIVVLNSSSAGSSSQATGVYYNKYLEHGLGNYRQLLEYVTFSHHMGNFLTYIENRKADPATGTVPDENYARELMQLFTIGLWELNHDGTRLLDAAGQPIPTYGNFEVQQFARIFTGLMWNWSPPMGDDTHLFPMRISPPDHEFGAKQLLDYPGAIPPGGVIPAIPPQSGNDALVVLDVQKALDNVFWHPNAAPFVGRQLIQRLVTSNPTPAYVARVATAFEGGGPYGVGVRGDLLATAKAILLDPEARDPAYRANPVCGLLKEPFIARYGLYRVLERIDRPNEAYPLRITTSQWDADTTLGQAFMRSPSVFNFYPPDYVPPGTELAAPGFFGPELRIHNDVTAISILDKFREELVTPEGEREAARYDDWRPLAGNPAALVDALDDELLCGTITPEARQIIINALSQMGPNPTYRVRAAVWLIAASPEFRVLR